MPTIKKRKALDVLLNLADQVDKVDMAWPGSPQCFQWRRDLEVAVAKIFAAQSTQFREMRGLVSKLMAVQDVVDPRRSKDSFQRRLRMIQALLRSFADEIHNYWEDEPATEPTILRFVPLPHPTSEDTEVGVAQADEGKIAEDAHFLRPYSAGDLIRTLVRFRECCQFISEKPRNELQVQDILWIMLRSQIDRLDREATLPRFGSKSYRPDFGVPELGIVIEVKFIGEKTRVASIQEQVLADIPGYMNDSGSYRGLVVFVYDAAHKLRDPRKFVEDIRSVKGIVDVIVVPGIG